MRPSAWHPTPLRSERGLSYFYHGLLAISRFVENWLSFVLLGGAAVLVATGCTGAKSEPRTAPKQPVSEPVSAGHTPTAGKQYLFHVRYSGPEGKGTLRLVLRLRAQQDFQLLTADSLGRSRWSLEVRNGRTLLLDHRQKTFCEGGEDLRLGEVSLTILPVVTLPRLLLGELPVGSAGPELDDGSTEFSDSEGRRWSIRREGGELRAWTLWILDAPTLWWTRQNKGGILSHRDGSQFRWRRVVEEPLAPTLPGLAPPDEYARVRCDDDDFPEFRQDQPAPPGSGSSK